MRSLIKNSGIQYVDEMTIQRERRRRRSLRLVIALSCIGLAGYFVFQLVSGGEPASGPAISWSEPKSIITWLRWGFNSISVQVRGAVNGSFPSGNLTTILKLVLCFGLGALFLRMPQRY